jgi:hypothetical protein
MEAAPRPEANKQLAAYYNNLGMPTLWPGNDDATKALPRLRSWIRQRSHVLLLTWRSLDQHRQKWMMRSRPSTRLLLPIHPAMPTTKGVNLMVRLPQG